MRVFMITNTFFTGNTKLKYIYEKYININRLHHLQHIPNNVFKYVHPHTRVHLRAHAYAHAYAQIHSRNIHVSQ